MRILRFNPSHLSAIALLSLAACGGGGGGDEPSNGGSTVTRAQMQSCPTSRMSPVDMAQMNCLVGTYTGSTTLDTSGQTPSRPCSVEVKADGSVTLRDGEQVHTQAPPSQGHGTYEPWDVLTSFSEYTGRKGAVDENGNPSDGMEMFFFGTNSGSKRADGSDVPRSEWTDLQIQYLGAIAGRQGIAIVTFVSADGLDKPRLYCHARL